MKLILDREDLKPEHQNVNCSRTSFQHFKEEVQAAIVVVGKAQFREYDGSNYNAICPTEQKREVPATPCIYCLSNDGTHQSWCPRSS